MTFKFEICCDNAAFDEEPKKEIVHCMIEAARQLHESRADTGTIRDTNGNVVGSYSLTL